MTDTQKLDYLIEQLTGMQDGIAEIKERLNKQERDIKYIKVFQDNRLERNMQMIIEGNFSIKKSLHDMDTRMGDDVMMHIQISDLECDMSRVKDKLGIM